MILLAALELQRWFQELGAPVRFMPVGGLMTGFLGGLTGQQGALRSIFLLRTGLPPARFIATGVMIAVLVDVSRLATYAASFRTAGLDFAGHQGLLVLAGSLAAFAGAWAGARYVDKLTLGAVRYTVACLMFMVGAALVAGILG
jgi:uncharacterized membrane protein YfcA